jgi:hypothetical protein
LPNCARIHRLRDRSSSTRMSRHFVMTTSLGVITDPTPIPTEATALVEAKKQDVS